MPTNWPLTKQRTEVSDSTFGALPISTFKPPAAEPVMLLLSVVLAGGPASVERGDRDRKLAALTAATSTTAPPRPASTRRSLSQLMRPWLSRTGGRSKA